MSEAQIAGKLLQSLFFWGLYFPMNFCLINFSIIAMEDNEEMDREGSENENVEGAEDDNQEKGKEYVKKEFFAQPYVSKFGNASENEVRALTTKNQR